MFAPWYNGKRFEIEKQFKNICKLLDLIPKDTHQNPIDPSEPLLEVKLMTWYNAELAKWEQDIFAIIAIKADIDEDNHGN
jgi:hypothetical protein